MEKALCIFLALLAICQAESIVENDSDEPCVSETGTWGTPALNEFKLCANGKTITLKCDPNFYYVNNSTVAGCIPAAKMDPKCINVNIQPPVCVENNLYRMLPSNTLSHFYLCESVNAEPILVPCPNGKNFSENDSFSGCFDWEMWREVSDCITY